MVPAVKGCAPEDHTSHLSIIETNPIETADQSATSDIRVYFDRYLDPNQEWNRTASLNSGEARFSIITAYDPVGRAIVVKPRSPLRPGIGYVLTLHHENISAMDGGRLPEDFELSFFVVPALEEVDPSGPTVQFQTDVLPIINESCSCHGPEPLVFPELVPQALINQSSQRQPDRMLVKPGQPLQSYLVQRLLPDYPGVRGIEKILTEDEIRLFISWVNSIGL